MPRLTGLLRSPRLALGVLGFLAAYCGLAAWLPWSNAGAAVPGWAVTLGLDRPFATPAFLVAVGLLFLSTLACLWDRTPGTLRLWRGRGEGYGAEFESQSGLDFAGFLRAEGFRGASGPLFRYRHALWGGWVLHLGLVVLIAGVAVQQGFHEGGAIELSEGESLSLSAPGAVFARERGPLASEAPPDLVVTLVAFDPFLHQPGYAPDRASRIRVEPRGTAASEVTVDRAEGVRAGPLTVYQAIPTGLALNVEIAGLGGRSFHLRERNPLSAEGEFTAPGGETVRLGVSGERPLGDPRGTGTLRVWIERAGGRAGIVPGTVFVFGTAAARLASVGRWAGFTYARSPGMPAVFAGFAIVLLGATLLVFPAGVAWSGPAEEGLAGRVFVTRGRELLLAEWARWRQNPPDKEAAWPSR
jgi:hypothetical protein